MRPRQVRAGTTAWQARDANPGCTFRPAVTRFRTEHTCRTQIPSDPSASARKREVGNTVRTDLESQSPAWAHFLPNGGRIGPQHRLARTAVCTEVMRQSLSWRRPNRRRSGRQAWRAPVGFRNQVSCGFLGKSHRLSNTVMANNIGNLPSLTDCSAGQVRLTSPPSGGHSHLISNPEFHSFRKLTQRRLQRVGNLP